MSRSLDPSAMYNNRPITGRRPSTVPTQPLNGLVIEATDMRKSRSTSSMALSPYRTPLDDLASDERGSTISKQYTFGSRKDQHFRRTSEERSQDDNLGKELHQPDRIENHKFRTDWLREQGTEPIDKAQQVFHKYTVKVIDLKTGHRSKPLSVALSEKFVDERYFPKRTTPWNQPTVRIVGNDNLPDFSLDEIQPVFMIESADDAKLCAKLGEYCLVSTGRKKREKKWVRFSITRVSPSTRSIDQLRIRYLQGDTSASKYGAPSLALCFDHENFSLDDIESLLALEGAEKQIYDDVLDNYIGQRIFDGLALPDDQKDKVIIRGNQVFVEDKDGQYGLQQKSGVVGCIVYDSNGTPLLSHKPCTGFFFQNTSVSDFLMQFMGTSNIVQPTDEHIARAAKALIGIKVTSGSSSDDSPYTIAGLGPTILLQPTILQEIASKPSLSALRYPNIPTVNIGSQQKPRYVPAEMCHIAGNDQMFHGKLPQVHSVQVETPISSLESQDGKIAKPQNGEDGARELYPHADTDFRLVFVNIMENGTDGKPWKALSAPAMSAFRHELGRRFNGKLKDAVAESKMMEASCDKLINCLRRGEDRGFGSVQGIKNVFIVAVPKDMPKEKVDMIRLLCDAHYGAQCQLVNAPELARRMRKSTPADFIRYTNQIVRKIYARACVPGLPGNPNQETPGAISANLARVSADMDGMVVGIHLATMESFRGTDTLGKLPVNKQQCYLVNIVSIRADMEDKRITSHVFRADDLGALISEVDACFDQHMDKRMPDRSLSLYLSGTCLDAVKDKYILTALRENIEGRKTPAVTSGDDGSPTGQASKASAPVQWESPIILRSFVPERNIVLHEKGAIMNLDELALPARLSDDLHDTIMPKVFRLPAGRFAQDGTLNIPKTPWRIVSIESAPVTNMRREKRRERSSSRYLQSRALPAILYLAQEASERSQLHVILKTEDTVGRNSCPYGLRSIHESLEDTFYFL